MSGLLPSAGGGHGVRHHLPDDVVSEFLAPVATAAAIPEATNNKRKRRPAGTPDPDAEVVALSPKTLMESDRYVCEICNQGFQRDQNLQMHRRRHKVPWKLLKKPSTVGTNKRVFICPERSCLHHDPAHALGDLVGIKKHYRRKHCTEKQWKCVKCSKRYAVQSDYKAHLKTCGTRGHCCDCGRVFSRVESFIEHQDSCGTAKRKQSGVAPSAATDGKPPIFHQDVTDRLSYDSRSQSSDTTQAISTLADSVLSDPAGPRFAADSPSAHPLVDVDDSHSRRVLESQQPAYTSATAGTALRPWLTELRDNNNNNSTQHLQQPTRLLQPQTPPTNSEFPPIRRVISNFVVHGSFNSMAPLPENLNATPSLSLCIGRAGSGSVSVDVHARASVEMPCLQLSIGPSSAEMSTSCCLIPAYADTKPSFRNSRESLGLLESPLQDFELSRSDQSSHPGASDGRHSDFALWNPEGEARRQLQMMEVGPTKGSSPSEEQSLRDFLAQAWRPGAMQGCGSR